MGFPLSEEPLTPVLWKEVSIDDAFWTPRLRANRERTLPHIYRMCKETGRIDALRLDWKPGAWPSNAARSSIVWKQPISRPRWSI